jgi:hypothetical protein
MGYFKIGKRIDIIHHFKGEGKQEKLEQGYSSICMSEESEE